MVQSVAAIANYYQAERARGASEDRLNAIAALFEQMKPPNLDLSVMDPPELIMDMVEPTQFDMSRIDPVLLQSVGQFVPEVAQFVEYAAPELVQDSEIGREGLDAQRAALQQMRQLAQGEGDPLLDARLRQAAEQAQITAQSRGESILQDAARRGRLGSGQELAAQLQAASDAQQMAAGQGDMAALESYRQALGAMRDQAQLGGQMRGQELSLQELNTNRLNQYNNLMTAARQSYLDQQANLANQAQMQNLAQDQRIADTNVGLQNEANRYNRDTLNSLRDVQRNQRIDEIERQNRNAMNVANWQRNERDRRAGLQQQDFANRMNIADRQAGIEGTKLENFMQNQRDNMQAKQSFADMLTSGAKDYATYSMEKDKYDLERRRAGL